MQIFLNDKGNFLGESWLDFQYESSSSLFLSKEFIYMQLLCIFVMFSLEDAIGHIYLSNLHSSWEHFTQTAPRGSHNTDQSGTYLPHSPSVPIN